MRREKLRTLLSAQGSGPALIQDSHECYNSRDGGIFTQHTHTEVVHNTD